MKYKSLIIKTSDALKLIIMFASLIIIAFFYACNPSYENYSGMLPTGLHPVKPPFSSVYHGAEYRFPDSSCNTAQCHGSNLTGGNTGSPSCYSCHNNLWNVFLVSHTESAGGRLHHYLINDSNYTANCGLSSCHGNYSYNNNTSSWTGGLYTTNQTGHDFRYACHACHTSIP
jgi:hypothetical protein